MVHATHPMSRSVEPGHCTYLLRRLVAAAVLAGLAGAATLTATGGVPRLDLVAGASQEPAAPGDKATLPTGELTTASLAGDQRRDAGQPAGGGSAGDTGATGGTGGAGEGAGAATGDPLPDRTSRLVPQAPERVLDTRRGGEPPPSPGTTHLVPVGPPAGSASPTGVVLAVSLVDGVAGGAVEIDGQAGAIEAIVAARPGTTTSNLVFAPLLGNDLAIRSSAGGHLIVDLVATLVPSGASASGRFVAIEPAPIARIETRTDGREADLDLAAAVPAGEASAVLVEVTADVGDRGGIIQLGPEGGDLDQMLMWGPAPGGDRQRRGLALIQPGDGGGASLRYQGGTVVTVDVVGYVTSDQADPSITGLYVPSGPRQLLSGRIDPSRPVVVGGLLEPAGIAVVTVGSPTAVPGHLGSVLLPVDRGTLTLRTNAELEATVILLGVFLAG